MTSNTDGAAQGEWYAIGKSALVRNLKGQCIGRYDCADESTAATLAVNLNLHEADHRKAQMADVLVKLLKQARGATAFGTIDTQEDWFDDVDAVLAQYHAATEEATRP